MRKKQSRSFGFSFIEFILVFFLIVLLSGYIWVSVNPLKIFSELRNIQRLNDLTQISNAITQYRYENNSLPFDSASLPSCESGGAFIGMDEDGIDLESKLVDRYLIIMPVDPSLKYSSQTGYKVCLLSGDTIELLAPMAEQNEVIVVRN